jgi:hypothetical protein
MPSSITRTLCSISACLMAARNRRAARPEARTPAKLNRWGQIESLGTGQVLRLPQSLNRSLVLVVGRSWLGTGQILAILLVRSVIALARASRRARAQRRARERLEDGRDALFQHEDSLFHLGMFDGRTQPTKRLVGRLETQAK